jgi:hypothetical protein
MKYAVLGTDLGSCSRALAPDQFVHIIQLDLIDVAPTPGLTGLERAHDGMPGAMEVFGCVFIGGGVAAADVAAFQAQAEVNPVAPYL